MLRQGRRNVAAAGQAGSIGLVAGRAEQLPFADATFDALTFTYLLRYVDDPQATLAELARVVKPGGTVASLEFLAPAGAVLAVLVVAVHPAAAARGRAADRRPGVVRGRPVPGPEHLRALPALPGGLDGRRLAPGRPRDVGVRVMSLGGGLVMWGTRAGD